jgi:hypothetical protein
MPTHATDDIAVVFRPGITGSVLAGEDVRGGFGLAAGERRAKAVLVAHSMDGRCSSD